MECELPVAFSARPDRQRGRRRGDLGRRDELLSSKAVGGKAATTTIYVPDEVFASPESLLTTLVVGDQVFINAYLLATTVFARQGNLMGSKFARYAAEIMATETVHRALALQSLGKLGNDRVYAKFTQREEVPGLPTSGAGGFFKILDAVAILESAGFGFGKPGSKPGTKYEYAAVAARTPTDRGVNTISISQPFPPHTAASDPVSRASVGSARSQRRVPLTCGYGTAPRPHRALASR